MPYRPRLAYALILTLLAAPGQTLAATSTIEVDVTNTIPNVIANALIADGEGDDWTGAVLRIDLVGGGIYNDPAFNWDEQQAVLWGILPQLRWDTAVGIPNDVSATTGIAGGLADLGGCAAVLGSECGPVLEGQLVRVSWFNSYAGDINPIQIGNISLTDDATGSWSMITSFAGEQVRTSGPVINGVMVPEPASFALLSIGGLVLLRRN